MKKLFLTYLLSTMFLGSAISQGTNVKDDIPTYKLTENAKQKLLERGDSLFAHAAYMESVRNYQDVEHNATIGNDAKGKMAEAYRCNAEYELAEYWYRQYIDSGANAKECLSFAKVLQANEKCEEASKWYKRYLATDPIDADDIEILSDCANLKSIVSHQDVIVYNMTDLNTAASEYSAMQMLDNLVFTSSRASYKISKYEDMWTDSEFSDLFNAQADEFGVYTNIDRLRGHVNKRFHDGVTAFDENQYRMYFTRNENKAITGKNIRELKLYAAKVDKQGNWYDVSLMSLNVPGYSSCHPTLSADGNTMIFASNRPGGLGGMDLYIAKRTEGKWTAAVNLGSSVNSPNNEVFPTISKTNDLFFASNGHVGLGGLDLYRANLRNKKLESGKQWTVQNMGQPFNSSKDDFSFYMAKDGLSGYYASNREGGAGKDDIYRWVRTSDDPLVLDWYSKSLCIDHFYQSNIIDDASVTLLEFADILKYPDLKSTGIEIAEKLDAKTQKTIEDVIDLRQLRLIDVETFISSDPDFKKIPLKPNRDYLFVITKDGYFVTSKLVTADENAAVYSNCVDVSLEPIRTLNGSLLASGYDVDFSEISIKLFNHCTKRTDVIRATADGNFTQELKCSCSYDLEIDQPGFERFEKKFKSFIDKCDTTTENVVINLKTTNPFKAEKIEKDKVFTLNNILYDFNSAALTSEALVELNYLLQAMEENPTMKINLSAFTDSRGEDSYNLRLSENRAKSAARYLFENGIDPARVQFIGMGERNILNDCLNGKECSEDEHHINRRTEVKVTSL